MPNLHAYFYHGNVKLFRQELDGTGAAGQGGGGGGHKGGGGGGGSLGKSWTITGLSGGKGDPNERDGMGRTVLHLAASSLTNQAYTFLSILLRNQQINVNLQDQESGYTALHRALFVGNIRAARDLLARGDTDLSIKDSEGLTAFDLYNGTIDGTNPPQGAEGTDLYVWGVNRNFALGTGDSSDKAYPDRVNLLTQNQASGNPDASQRFYHVGVKDVVMAKLHTGVITSEARGNLSVCGFGSNGRLGRTVHSQLSLLPLPDLPHTITHLSLAQDHTLALTSGGYILSWGHNRFAQLGYPIEAADNPQPTGKFDDTVQVSPRRIVGPLKKEWVVGVAAGRMSSACWTKEGVWTWGTNAGHLGYEKMGNPVQVMPRKVTAISQEVIDIALSDYAMICLLETNEVLCFHHDTNFKISFSTPRILSDAFPFRPPQSTIKPMINKVTSCGTVFAALSSIGDVFTFSLPNPAEDVSKGMRDRHVTVKPQLIWALRKRFDAVEDVALGSDGTVIICTTSGHVFVRQRTKAGAGQLKFRRIPYLQRVIKVAVNESGAFAAIRVDAKPTPIILRGRTLEEDLGLLQPHVRRFESQMTAEDFDADRSRTKGLDEDEEDEGTNSVTKDLAMASKLCTILRRWRSDERDSLFSWGEGLLGSDVYLQIGDRAIPAHATVLALRSKPLERLLSGGQVDGLKMTRQGSTRSIIVSASHSLVVLLLLQYIYTDEVAAVWDARVARALQDKYPELKLCIADIKADLTRLALTLELSPLSTALNSAGKVPITSRTLPRDVQAFFAKTSFAPSAPSCDVTLVLAEKEVKCSSILLRARCPFFESMFSDKDWTSGRMEDGNVIVQMRHLKWRPMKLVFKYLHEGVEDNLFDYIHQETLDEFLDFVFEVLAAATELLLDRLVLVCSRVIIRHCNAYNAASLACEAAFYQADTLKLSLFDYIASSMETMLESGLLDDMHEDVLHDLCEHVGQKQNRKLSVSRAGKIVSAAMERQKEWLSLQDIPVPRVRQPWRWKGNTTREILPVPSDATTAKKGRRQTTSTPSPVTSPDLQPTPSTSTAVDDIFTMDEEVSAPANGSITPRMARAMTPMDLLSGQKSAGPVWKSKAVEADKVDLRSIMAETQASKTPLRPAVTPTPGRPGSTMSGRQASMMATPSKSSPSTSLSNTPPASASTWRAVEPRTTSFTTLQAQQTSSSPAGPSRLPVSTPQRPNANRTITPIKLQAAPPSTQRKASSGAAWASTTTNFAPPPAPLVVGSPETARTASLLAIQQEERAFAADQSVKKPMRSFADIQAEERVAEESRVQELEFMRWWEEEQARVSQAAGKGGKSKAGAGGRGGGGGRGGQQKRVPGRGRGGGKAGGVTNSQATNGQATNGQDRNGQATNGQATNGQAPSGEGRATDMPAISGLALNARAPAFSMTSNARGGTPDNGNSKHSTPGGGIGRL